MGSCILYAVRFQGIVVIGCFGIGDYTEVSFMNWCACLFIRVVACSSAKDMQGLLIYVTHRLIGVFTMVGCFFDVVFQCYRSFRIIFGTCCFLC